MPAGRWLALSTPMVSSCFLETICISRALDSSNSRSGSGFLSTSRKVWRSTTSSLSICFRHIGVVLAIASLPIRSSSENFTSSAVSSPKPSWNCTPLRRKNVHVFASGDISQRSASIGRS